MSRSTKPLTHAARASLLALALVATGCGTTANSLETEVVADTNTAPAPTFAIGTEADDRPDTDTGAATAERSTDPTTDAPETAGDDEPSPDGALAFTFPDLSEATADPGDAPSTAAASPSNVNVFAASIKAEQLSSARFLGTITMTSPELGDTITITFGGAYDAPNQASSMEFNLGALAELDSDLGLQDEAAGMFAEPMRMITIGDTAWVQWGLLTMFGVEPGMWLEADGDSDSLAGGFETPMTSPTELLEQFADADATIEDLGVETLRGAEATHYLVTIDMEQLAETMSAEERAELEADFGNIDTLPSLPLHAWIDDDGQLHKFELALDADSFEPAMEAGAVSMTYEIYDHGQDLGITAPDPAMVISESELSFGN